MTKNNDNQRIDVSFQFLIKKKKIERTNDTRTPWAKIGQSAVNKLNLPGNQEQRNESVIYKTKFRCLNNKIN